MEGRVLPWRMLYGPLLTAKSWESHKRSVSLCMDQNPLVITVLTILWAEAHMSQEGARPGLTHSNKTSCLSPKHHRCSAVFLPPWQRWQTTDHWHFRGQCRGSKIVRISPNQLLSSHSCHTTHCPWTRTYPRLRLGGSDRLEGIANILKWNTKIVHPITY